MALTPWQLRQIQRSILAGGVIAYPTEAVYGLGCHPDDTQAIQRILALKQRPAEKGLILIASDWQQFQPYVHALPESQMKAIHASWPGPVTWLLPATTRVSPWLCGIHTTLAVRVSSHPQVQQLCRALGHPLVSTSANRSGQQPARSALQVRRYFDQTVDVIIAGRCGLKSKPSEIRDGVSGRIIRQG